MERAASPARQRVERGAVSVGFAALAVAVLVAYTNPASAYELSVYAGTPMRFWVGFGIALVVSVFAALLTRDGSLRLLALVLGGCSIVAFAGLPVIRGYFLHAGADTMTHVGWTREMAVGNLHPIERIYPGVHEVTVFVAQSAGYRLERGATLVVVVFVVVYLLFVPLSMRRLTSSVLGRTIGALSAFLLLPINVFVTQLTVMPISQAVFYFALVFFLFTKYVTIRDGDGRFTSIGLLLALASSAVVLYHPQQTAVVLLLFGTVSLVQLVDRRWSDAGRVGSYRLLFAQTIFLAVVFVVWAGLHSNITGQMSGIIETILQFLEGTGDGATASEVAQRGSSLTAVGSGLGEIFLKLFLVSADYSLLAAFVMLASVFSRPEHVDSDVEAIQRYVSFGFMALSPFAFLHFVGGMSKFYFRYHASMMLIVTVLGALGLYYFAGYRRHTSSSRPQSLIHRVNPVSRVREDSRPVGDVRRVVVGVVIVSMLGLSLASVFPSPFIYQAGDHVTEEQFEGYRTAFAHQDPKVEMSGVSMPHWRYRHAILGATGRVWGPTYSPRGTYDHNITGYLRNVTRTEQTHYLVVTEADIQTEADAYRGLRFNESDFRALRAAPHVNLVQSNGEFKLYYAVAERTSNTTAASIGAWPTDSVDERHWHVESPRERPRTWNVPV